MRLQAVPLLQLLLQRLWVQFQPLLLLLQVLLHLQRVQLWHRWWQPACSLLPVRWVVPCTCQHAGELHLACRRRAMLNDSIR